MTTQFLRTKRLVTPLETKELTRIAQSQQCVFVRRSGRNDVVKGWFEGPGLSDVKEGRREAEIILGLLASGIRYPLDE